MTTSTGSEPARSADTQLELLTRLETGGSPSPDIPEFLVLSHDRTLHRRLLQQADPVAELIGTRAEPDWNLIGIRASATAHRQDHPADPGADCSIIHLLDRSGMSTTRLVLPDREHLTLGPDRTIRDGRIPDTCRRVFGLPTSPPPEDMIEFVLDAWLTLVLRAALVSPGLRWAEIVRLNLSTSLTTVARPEPPTLLDQERLPPARLAEATIAAARALDWGRYRHACMALGGCPVTDLGVEAIDWMDTGMFARWAQHSLPTAGELLELLEPALGGQAFDRLWATVSLCRESIAQQASA